MKRQLTKVEKELNQKAIDRLNEEITDLIEVHLADAELIYNKKLDYSYKKQKREYLNAIKELKNDIAGKKKQMESLLDQNINGVEKKENTQAG